MVASDRKLFAFWLKFGTHKMRWFPGSSIPTIPYPQFPTVSHSIPWPIANLSVLVNRSFPEIHQVDSWIHAEKTPRVSLNRPIGPGTSSRTFLALTWLSPCFTPKECGEIPWFFYRFSEEKQQARVRQVSVASSNINFQAMTSAWISAAAKSCLVT